MKDYRNNLYNHKKKTNMLQISCGKNERTEKLKKLANPG